MPGTHQLDFIDPVLRQAPPLDMRELICTKEKAFEVLELIETSQEIGFDTETTGLCIRPWDYRRSVDDYIWSSNLDIMTGFSVAVRRKEKDPIGWYLPVYHRSFPCLPYEVWKQVLDACIACRKLYMHNAAFDVQVLSCVYEKDMGRVLSPDRIYDTLISIHTLLQGEESADKRQRNILGLKKLCRKLLNKRMKDFDTLWVGENALVVDIEQMAKYASDDAVGVMMLSDWAKEETKQHGTDDYLKKVGFPMLQILSDIHNRGVRVDRRRLAEMQEQVREKIHRIELNIQHLGGRGLNIRSGPQMENFFYEKIGIAQTVKRSKTGRRKVSAEALEGSLSIALKQPESYNEEVVFAIQQYLDHVALTKTDGHFLTKLLRMSERDGRVYPWTNQTGTVSARFSSRDPNIQQMPSRRTQIAGLNLNIRSCFLPDEDETFIVWDESGLEMRILAHYTKDPVLIETFHLPKDEGGDPHAATGCLIEGITREQWEILRVEDPQTANRIRNEAKAINFGIIYGRGAEAIGAELGMTREEAAEFIANYFEKFPSVKNWLDSIETEVLQTGYVKTLLGRYRRTSLHRSLNRGYVAGAIRSLRNGKIQGSAADIINTAMVRTHYDQRFQITGARILFQVHDEIVLSAPRDSAEEAAHIVRYYMENPFPDLRLLVPLCAEGGVVDTWAH